MGSFEAHHVNGNGTANGNGVTWRWLVGMFGSAFIVIGGWAWGSTTARVLELEKLNTANAIGVVKVDAETASIKARLERIEFKLDALLESRAR